MKIAVYTIAKNEAKFVHRWYESAKEADYLFILDTGSSDDTVELAKSLGINVQVKTFNPWRFDHARQASLEALPDDIDYCIALDMDEILQPGWRKALESVAAHVTRPRYQYTWSWNHNGSPGLVYGGDKIHARHGYFWKHPVHEVLNCTTQEIQSWIDLEIHHHPDHSKSRGQYLPLLAMAVDEDPADDRNAFYYARELFFHSHPKAADEFKRHLSLPRATWKPERAASMRYLAKIEADQAQAWLLRAAAEAPDRREAWVELARLNFDKDWASCYAFALRALSITEKPLEYLCEEFAWGAVPYDLAALAAWNLGLLDEAATYGAIALELDPNNQRLIDNLGYYLNPGKSQALRSEGGHNGRTRTSTKAS